MSHTSTFIISYQYRWRTRKHPRELASYRRHL